jgi:hypothetical protein
LSAALAAAVFPGDGFIENESAENFNGKNPVYGEKYPQGSIPQEDQEEKT